MLAHSSLHVSKMLSPFYLEDVMLCHFGSFHQNRKLHASIHTRRLQVNTLDFTNPRGQHMA